ncbi:hypothetical protein [Cupriavidus sp. HPC(L)]|uniref:hypothetical protein n=1 Tax=Cupriavidus sp. HPC(L) TaxID=1217418 RepID=UPI00209D9FE6|nr:hypothetical protein [Cupriavidus sp. HPC(L)]
MATVERFDTLPALADLVDFDDLAEDFWTLTTFSVFLADLDDLLAASAMGAAISAADTSMVAATEGRGRVPRNLRNGRSNRDMILGRASGMAPV